MFRLPGKVKSACAVFFTLFACAAWAQSNVSVFAQGLNNPRGLKFGPDGNLYVAEGGAGGTTSSAGLCDQVVPPVGPYTGGFTARISKISPDGTRTTVIDGLPSDQTSAAQGSLVFTALAGGNAVDLILNVRFYLGDLAIQFYDLGVGRAELSSSLSKLFLQRTLIFPKTQYQTVL